MDRMDFHNPSFFITGFQAAAICNSCGTVIVPLLQNGNSESKRKKKKKLTQRIPHPVGTNAKMQAKMSGTDNGVKITAMTRPVRAIKKVRPWMKRNRSWKLTDIFWLNVNTCENKARSFNTLISKAFFLTIYIPYQYLEKNYKTSQHYPRETVHLQKTQIVRRGEDKKFA